MTDAEAFLVEGTDSPEAWKARTAIRRRQALEAFRLIQAIYREHLPAAVRLERFQAMAVKYPGVGWEDAVRATEALL